MSSLQTQMMQGRANKMLDAWMKASTAADSVKGSSVSKREATALLTQAKDLPKNEVESLKKALVAQLAANAFTVAPDARQLFADFFKIPLESIPTTSTKRTSVNSAQATRVANETDSRVKLSTREVKDFLKNATTLPENLKSMVGTSLMNQLKAGSYKMDADARGLLTRFIAQAGAVANPFSMADGARVAGDLGQGAAILNRAVAQNVANIPRQMMAEVVNRIEDRGGLDALDRSLSMGAQPMSYAAYVAAHGGSFEEILFAFLMQIADKADKKLMEKMKEMERKEKGQHAVSASDARIKDILGKDGALPTPAGDAAPAAGGGVAKKVSTQLEALVQSVDAMVRPASEGGVQVTKGEADRLVARLKTLPANVQELMAGSIATAMKHSSMHMQPEAQSALVAWGKSVRGNKFDITPTPAGTGTTPGNLAKPLSESKNLEDKIAGFLVDTLTSDTQTLKQKFVPFKAMRAELDSLNPAATTPAADATAPAKAEGKKGKKDAAANPLAEANAAVEALKNNPAAVAGAQAPEGGSGIPDNATSGTSDTQDQNEIQRLMGERTRVFEMLSNMMKAMQDMIMTSVRNMR